MNINESRVWTINFAFNQCKWSKNSINLIYYYYFKHLSFLNSSIHKVHFPTRNLPHILQSIISCVTKWLNYYGLVQWLNQHTIKLVFFIDFVWCYFLFYNFHIKLQTPSCQVMNGSLDGSSKFLLCNSIGCIRVTWQFGRKIKEEYSLRWCCGSRIINIAHAHRYDFF